MQISAFKKLNISWVFVVLSIAFRCSFIYAEQGDENMKSEKAIVAGGCFWCVESVYKGIPGIIDAVSGYTGGKVDNPSYEAVSSGSTGHTEAVEVTFDPAKISYEEVLNVFWRDIDPTDTGGQFADRGSQYHTAIFYLNDEQKRIAEKSKADLQASGLFKKPIVTQILPAGKFFRAEEYHQDYSDKQPQHYKMYRYGSGREEFVNETWKNIPKVCPLPRKAVKPMTKEFTKPDDKVLKEKLTPLQYNVTQKEGTEPPFKNEYWNNHREGIYVDVVSGEPLFSSKDKYDSGTGWPSFTRPLDDGNIVEKTDKNLFMERTEVRSKHGDSHLGHVFPDGPEPTGTRFCMNSASLRFIPKEDLEKEGYGQYKGIFEDKNKH